MRTRRLCGWTLVVLMLHAIGWQIACSGLSRFAPASAGIYRIAIVSAPPAPRVPSAPVDAPRSAVPTPTPRRPPHALAAPASGRPRAADAITRRPRAGNGGMPAHAREESPEWPVYPTRAPPSATVRYVLFQGGNPTPAASAAAPAQGDAELEWTHDSTMFSLRLTTTLADRAPREWQSTGGFDAAGVAPSRLVERDRGRDKRAINFDRDGGRVRFSGASGVLPIAPGAQDRWSWVAQLAAIAEAAARRGRTPTHWDLQVAGLRGDLERWTFQVLPPGEPPAELVQGNELSTHRLRAPALLHVLRAAERPYDLRIEAWLSPSLHHLPAGLRMSTPPGGWSLALWQRRS